jgi:hypothetical protein
MYCYMKEKETPIIRRRLLTPIIHYFLHYGWSSKTVLIIFNYYTDSVSFKAKKFNTDEYTNIV